LHEHNHNHLCDCAGGLLLKLSSWHL
jgi:hypothetical protein